MSVTTILFDMDDTLINTMPLFTKYNNKISSLVAEKCNLPSTFVLEKFNEIDLNNISLYGLSPKRYNISWVDTLSEFNIVDSDFEFSVNTLIAEMFSTKIEKFRNIDKTLAKLKNEFGINLVLVTSGDFLTQCTKIDYCKFNDIFDAIHIPKIKTSSTYQNILNTHNLIAKNTLMVGNSLSSDIKPALDCGIKCIHITNETWSYDAADIKERFFTLDSVENIFNILPFL